MIFTYFLDADNNPIARKGFGDTLEEVYPGIAAIIEVNLTTEGWDAVKMTKSGTSGWIPREYRLVSLTTTTWLKSWELFPYNDPTWEAKETTRHGQPPQVADGLDQAQVSRNFMTNNSVR